MYKSLLLYVCKLLLKNRIKIKLEGYKLLHYKGIGVDNKEQVFKSKLVTIEEAVKRLGKSSVCADVVLRG